MKKRLEKPKQEKDYSALLQPVGTKQELERGITITNIGKQETLEEVAERLFPTNTNDKTVNYQNKVRKPNWIQGAKWQQEQDKNKYSDAIDYFITEIKTEFKDENWDYLDFIKERVLTKIKNK
jgi:hypothetical protein